MLILIRVWLLLRDQLCFGGNAVAFNLYDLGKTGSINKTELKNLLVDVLADNPGLRLTDEQIDRVIEQACSPTLRCPLPGGMSCGKLKCGLLPSSK